MIPAASVWGSVARKVVWAMLMLFGIGFMIFQIQDRINYYLSWPTVVDYKLIEGHDLRFPSVTICSVSSLSRKAINKHDPLFADVMAKVFPVFPSSDPQAGVILKLFNVSSWTGDWESDFLAAGAEPLDGLLECHFKNEPCNLTDAIEKMMTDAGLCFTFNPQKSNYRATEPGAGNGLRLTLWTNQSDYISTTTPAAGFWVLLHNPAEIPMVVDFGLHVSPGTTTSISFSVRNVTQLPSPYGECNPATSYNFANCMRQCLNIFFVAKCGCRPLQFRGNFRSCSPFEYLCSADAFTEFIASGASKRCDCPLQCNQLTFLPSISANRFSQQFLNYTTQQLNLNGKNITMSNVEREIAFLDIYLSTMLYPNFETKPAYNLLGLLCDIGGAFGLILGATVLTIVEIFQFIFGLLELLLQQVIQKRV